MESGQYIDNKSKKENIDGLSIHEDNQSIKIPTETWIARVIDHLIDDTMPNMYKTQLDTANRNMKKVVDYIMRHL